MQSVQPVQHGYRDTVAALRAAEDSRGCSASPPGWAASASASTLRAGLFVPYRGQQAIPAATGGAVFDIDEVAAGRPGHPAPAVSGAMQTAVCTHYRMAPFPAKKLCAWRRRGSFCEAAADWGQGDGRWRATCKSSSASSSSWRATSGCGSVMRR